MRLFLTTNDIDKTNKNMCEKNWKSNTIVTAIAANRNSATAQQQKTRGMTRRGGMRSMLQAFVILPLLFCLLLTSCKHKDLPEPYEEKNMTVVLYIVAENSLASYASYDLNEIENAIGKIPNNCNFVVYVDNHMQPKIYTFDARKGKVEHRRMEERNSCDPAVFEQNIREIVNEFPAEHYGLVLWSHGSGWIPSAQNSNKVSAQRRTFGIDNNYNSTTSNVGTELEIADMRKALENIGIKWDYIFFDTCFMQCIESAYELRNLTDYIIASPAEIPANGAPYDKIMDCLTEKDEKYFYNLSQVYFDSYKNGKGLVLSTIKTDELDSLLRVTRKVAPDYYEQASSLDIYTIQMYHPNGKPEYFDMASTLHKILSEEDYNEWRKQADKTIITQMATKSWETAFNRPSNTYEITDADHIVMVSIFIPNKYYDLFKNSARTNEGIKKTEWYRDYNQQNTDD